MESTAESIEEQNNILKHIQRMVSLFQVKPTPAKTKGYVHTVLEDLEQSFRTFKDGHEQILSVLKEKSIAEKDVDYIHTDVFYTCYDIYVSFKSSLLDIIYELESPQTSTGNSDTYAMTTRNETFIGGARLPKINLPIFSGDYLDWISYRDTFLSLVHQSPSLTKIQKFLYLQSSCTGTPLSIVNEYPTAESSYEIAWEALERRFFNKRKIVDQIIQRLFSIQPAVGNVQSVQQLLDTTRSCLSQLKALEIDISTWDAILVFMTSQKLDAATRKDWELSLKTNTSIPSITEMLTFLETTFRALECIRNENQFQPNKNIILKPPENRRKPAKLIRAHTAVTTMLDENCPCCKKRHPLYKCFKFLSLSSNEKKNIIAQHRLCRNCLRIGHMQVACKLPTRCQNCNEPHHTVVHNEFSSEKNPSCSKTLNLSENQTFSQPASTSTPTTSNVSTHHSNTFQITPALLPTVVVILKVNSRKYHVKALVDQGSQVSFISEDLSQLMPLPQHKTAVNICGIGGNKLITVKRSIDLKLYSTYDKHFELKISALIVPTVTKYGPPKLTITSMPDLSQIFLADPKFLMSEKIDLLLGNDVYSQLLLPKMKKLENGLLLQETYFGFMISGSLQYMEDVPTMTAHSCSVENQLRLFWEQEELLDKKPLTAEEQLCETFFKTTYTRNESGRFTVHLPFKSLLHGQPLPKFSHTDYNALKRLKQLETSFKNKPIFAEAYRKFMTEYENLMHMKNLGEYPQAIPKGAYFFPHHGVLRESSTTTKLRVVFDGRNKRLPETSINEELAAGPPLQNDLSLVISRWRRYKIAFTADIEKMFRQINICEEHHPLQCILWRDASSRKINVYSLQTVTYGTTSAPYLAIRVLHELAKNEERQFPQACKLLRSDTYVDDIISGADTLVTARNIKLQLCALLKSGGFHLRKWNSNSKQLLEDIPEEDRENKDLFNLNKESMTKALGLYWDTNTDTFRFSINFISSHTITKRTLLSEAAKLFDPLGWLSPTTIKAKIMFQLLWKLKLDWDDVLPEEIRNEWRTFRTQLASLEKIRIPRWLGCASTKFIQLHGFSDASQNAYAAVVYARVKTEAGEVLINLLQSKTRVAPVKKETIPRLELCAATLLAQLMSKLISNHDLNIKRVVYWTDSTIVLAWLKSLNKKLDVYIANRVSKIQNLSDIKDWRYIPSSDNPADCASRGISPEALRDLSLWWNGPQWLKLEANYWPTNISETKGNGNIVAHLANTSNFAAADYPEIALKYSTLSKLVRVTSYIFRFFDNLKCTPVSERNTGFLKTAELTRAKHRLIKLTQAVTYAEEIHCLKSKKPLPKHCRISQLAPFLDTLEILRVGGRISQAEIPFHAKHPILLSKENPLSLLIFSEAHKQTCHGSLLLMLSYVSRHYWVVSARALAKRVQRECIVCFKYKKRTCQQLMGELPAVRLQPTRAFKHSGVDYAGPISVKNSNLRTSSYTKGYICLFICMCTKAIHLETVTSLNVDAFLAAFRRFTARRGICTDLYSDCGTNFIGASKELQVIYNRNRASLPEHLVETLANQGTQWHFIPPASPHFGGLWEAGVKSTKYHLRRIIKDRLLTYEELNTLLAQIESILNSRPICPLSTDPEDHNALTPAHFLIGEPTVCIPDEQLLDANINRISRWQQIERLKQHFWARWNKEYLCRLQSRPKWTKISNNVKVGDLVLLLREKSVPGQWPLAKVVKVHPGSDGLVRIVTLYCNKKYILRPISKICLLPTNEVTSQGHISNQNP